MNIIYNDDICEYIAENKKEIIENLKLNDLPITDSNIYSDADIEIKCNGDYLLSLLNNYDNKIKYDCILCVADLGLWYGRRKATAKFKSLNAAMQKCFYDINKIYFDNKNTTLRLDAVHHDGVNRYKFYKVVNNKKYAIKLNEVINL